MGGMVASHIATHSKAEIDVLIADRTFSRLDSVASRLLGEWASFGINYFLAWDTNVVDDYLKCR